MNSRRRLCAALPLLILSLLSLVGCDDARPADADATSPAEASGRWSCPRDWVAGERGGCGPAVLLCVPGGGARAGACDGVDLTAPGEIALPDGGTVAGFRRLPDGAVGGAWSEPGEPGGPPARDGSPDAGATVDGNPAMPSTMPCPGGWQSPDGGGCDPALRADCPTGSEPMPGGGCTPTAASDCPSGPYAEPGVDLMGARVWYVRAEADASSADGSEAHPFATLAAAQRSAGDRDWLLLAAGDYAGSLELARGTLHVLGVCAARVTLRGDGTRSGLSVVAAGATLDVRGVTVTGFAPGIFVRDGVMTVSGVRVVGNTTRGAEVTGATARLEFGGSVIADTLAGGALGQGIVVRSGALLTALRVALAGNVTAGIDVADARADLTGVTVRGTRGLSGVGRGVYVGAAGQLTARGLVVEGGVGAGVLVEGEGATAALTYAFARGMTAAGLSDPASALEARGGAEIQAIGALLTTTQGQNGVRASGVGTRVTLQDSALDRVGRLATGTVPVAVLAAEGASVRVVRTRVSNAPGSAAAVLYRATMSLEDVSMVDCGSPSLRTTGIIVQSGGRLTATRVAILGPAHGGLSVGGGGLHSEATLAHALISGVIGTATNAAGVGVRVTEGAAVRLSDLLCADCGESALEADGVGTTALVEDATVLRTRLRPGGTAVGALSAGTGAHLTARRVRVEQASGFGVSARDPGSEVDLAECVVREVRPLPNGNAYGLSATSGGVLRGAGVRVSNVVGFGAALDQGGALTLDDSAVVGTGAVVDPDSGVSSAGVGVGVFGGGSFVANRLLVAQSEGFGLVVRGAGSQGALAQSVVSDTRVYTQGARAAREGEGVLVLEGASLQATGLVVERSERMGLLALSGASVSLAGSVVRDNGPYTDNSVHRGVHVQGSVFQANGLLVTRCAELGVADTAGTVTLADSIVEDITPTARGLGLGLYVCEGVMDVERVAVQRAAGAGFAAVPLDESQRGITMLPAMPSRARLTDVMVRETGLSTVNFSGDRQTFTPNGLPVAYGLHAAEGASVTAVRVLIDRGSEGVSNVGGTLEVTTGVIARQSVAAALYSRAAPSLVDVAEVENATGARRDPDALSVASLPPSLSACETGDCP